MNLVYGLVAMLLLLATSLAQAQVIALDDSFGVPGNVIFGEPFIVEQLGVLENDTLDGETDKGLTAELLTSTMDGTLTCPDDAALELCENGSFEYTPGAGFNGTDSFTYRAFSGTTQSVTDATVTLTACTQEKNQAGDTLEIFSCWKESSYRDKLQELGYNSFEEGFEKVAWQSSRTPGSSPEIVSQGISWTSNHPATNDIATGSGAARTGDWGAYDPDHGYATGVASLCDVDVPPEPCLYHDGISGEIKSGGVPQHQVLRGVGGYLSSNTGAGSIDIFLYGADHPAGTGTQINAGKLAHATSQFFGVIDATPTGFTGFEFREVDGKIGQAIYIFADDFTIATSATCLATGFDIPAGLWTRFALPCDMAPGDRVEDIFAGLNTDSLVAGDYGSTWVLFSRDASSEGYVQLGLTEPMANGTGLWVFSTNASTVGVSGSVQSIADIDLVGMPGVGRYNYVAHNQNTSVDWSLVEVVDSANVLAYGEYDQLNGGAYDCDAPVQADCVMSRKMYKWNGSAYQVFDGTTPGSMGTLEPFDSFWVKAFKNGIKLRIPDTAAGPAIAMTRATPALFERSVTNLAVKKDKVKKPKKPSYEPWYIRLIASAGVMEDPGNVLGQLETSTDGNDPHDLEEPLPEGSRYLSILFTNPLFESAAWGFTTDFRSLTKRPRGVWPFVVRAHAGIGEITLHWEGESELFKNAWLVDEDNGVWVKAAAGQDYTFELTGGEHHFRFEVGK